MSRLPRLTGAVLSAGLAACAHTPLAATLAPANVAAEAPLLQVEPGIYSAGQPAASDWREIAARGVRTVVNLRADDEMAGRDEAAEVAAAGLRYISLPVPSVDAITPAAAQRLAEILADAHGAPVLVHCASANRAGGLLALALAQQRGLPASEALALGRRAGMKSSEARVRELLGAPRP